MSKSVLRRGSLELGLWATGGVGIAGLALPLSWVRWLPIFGVRVGVDAGRPSVLGGLTKDPGLSSLPGTELIGSLELVGPGKLCWLGGLV